MVGRTALEPGGEPPRFRFFLLPPPPPTSSVVPLPRSNNGSIPLAVFEQALALRLSCLHLGSVPPEGIRQVPLLQGDHETEELVTKGFGAGKPVRHCELAAEHDLCDAVPDAPLRVVKEPVHLLAGKPFDEDHDPVELHPRIDSQIASSGDTVLQELLVIRQRQGLLKREGTTLRLVPDR